MEEIKFNCWNPKEKRMILWNDRIDEYLLSIRLKQEEDVNYKHLRFLQYTGVKDAKTKEEIYAGDIIKDYGEEHEQHDGILGEVKLVDCSFVLVTKESVGTGYTNLTKHHIYEKLGNIYENPELLEVKKDDS